MQRYWEWLVGRVPPWIAPNLITIIGLATNVFTTLVLVYYCPTATEQVCLHLQHIKTVVMLLCSQSAACCASLLKEKSLFSAFQTIG